MLAFAAAAQAVGVEPTIGQAALLAAGTNLATAIPAGPGLRRHVRARRGDDRGSVGIDQEAALAFGLLVHLATLLVTSIGGAIVLIFGHRRPETDEAPAAERRRDGRRGGRDGNRVGGGRGIDNDGRPAG